MSTLPNIGIILPTLGADIGTWDDKINAGFTLLDAHDHTSGKGVQITTSAININADLTFSSLYGATNMQRIAFAAVTALASGSKSLFVNTSDNELYWRTNAGTNVKLTSGTSLNVAAFVGGIGGDYTSVAAAVAFDDANDRYTFKQNSATGWARLASGDVRLYETGTSENVYVGLKAPGALAAAWDVTFPLAAPASTVPLQMDSAGVITAAIFADSPLFTNALTLSIPAALWRDPAASHAVLGNSVTLAASTNALYLAITLPLGMRITGYTLYVRKTTNGADTIAARLTKTNSTTGTNTNLGAGTTNNANNPGFITMAESGLSETITGAEQYYMVFTPGGATVANHSLWHLQVSYTRPV